MRKIARFVGGLSSAALLSGCGGEQQIVGDVPLYTDLGDHHYEITTDEPLAQRYFDQGLRLYYAFNHAEAVRAFREAQRLDPDCAMCRWGEALSWGPNINLPMDSASGVAAYAAAQAALGVRENGDERERALIEALAVRYTEVPTADRIALDRAYAEAMAEVSARFPEDPEASVLFAESLMDLRPWDYWTADGEPQEGIAEALALLERVVAQDPTHPGACHFYIHAVEKVYPERAVACAERLAGLMPGAGHLVHMPGHIYVRVGRYLDAVEANRHAVHADETYIQDQQPLPGMYTIGYYPHNYDFMAFAAMMIGRSAESIDAATRVASLLPQEVIGAPGMDFVQHWSIRPNLVRIRFGRWAEILDEPAPPDQFLHSRGMMHYARGRALAATGDIAGATAELEQLRGISRRPELTTLKMEYNMSVDLLGIAERVLTGRIEAAAGRFGPATEVLREAVRREDALLYGEPPEWTVPARQDLGAVFLISGRAAEAEQAFREDLAKFPENGWSLHGLATALRAQGRAADADEMEATFGRVWQSADVPPPEWSGP
jgi:tetratricopeptide (TPR) repeat protein